MSFNKLIAFIFVLLVSSVAYLIINESGNSPVHIIETNSWSQINTDSWSIIEEVVNEYISYEDAIDSGEIDNCDKIEDKNEISRCKDEINLLIAKKELKSDLCEQILDEELKNNCIDFIDQFYYSNEKCDLIVNDNLKKECLNLWYYKLYEQAINTKSYWTCDSIKNNEIKNECIQKLDLFYYWSATDIKTCTEIKDVDLKTKCISRVKIIFWDYNYSLSNCSKIKYSELKQLCYDKYYFWVVSSWDYNENLCLKINSLDLQKECKTLIIKNRTDIISEKKIELLESIWDKIWALNIKCEIQNSGNSVILCKRKEIINLAVEKNDLSLCDNLNDITHIEICVNNSKFEIDNLTFKKALSQKDKNLCDSLYDKSKVDFCKSYIK